MIPVDCACALWPVVCRVKQVKITHALWLTTRNGVTAICAIDLIAAGLDCNFGVGNGQQSNTLVLPLKQDKKG